MTALTKPMRWESPFGADMTEDDVEWALSIPVLAAIDESAFSPHCSLRGILANDARIQTYRPGDVVVRYGDYGHSVFGVLEGSVRVLLDREEERILGTRKPQRHRSLAGAFSRLWRPSGLPETRRSALSKGTRRGMSTLAFSNQGEARQRIDDVNAVIENCHTIQLNKGQLLGEIAALARVARRATVFAETDTVLVEIRWQGMREMRRRDVGFRHYIDSSYRARSLMYHLAESPLFRHLDEEVLRRIANKTSFETHGEFEWNQSFKSAWSRDSRHVIDQEPLIAEEGHYVNGLMMVRSGFARVSTRQDQGHRTLGHLSNNELFGLEEILDHWRHGTPLTYRRSLRAVGYLDVLEVPTALVEQFVLPNLPPDFKPQSLIWNAPGQRQSIPQSLVEFLVDGRIINGTSAMMINMQRCVGCDDCVRACAAVHDGNPRFIRHGLEHSGLLFANACMHCVDPICLIGCPVGAIQRTAEEGWVIIDDETCIGCETCANTCPYNNIRMVEICNEAGDPVIYSKNGLPAIKATKCDLCYGRRGGPACQRACPHDAMIRIDLHQRDQLVKWVNR